MPRYEYRCQVCDDRAERVRPVDERNDPIDCSNCVGVMTRVFHPTPFDMRRVARATL